MRILFLLLSAILFTGCMSPQQREDWAEEQRIEKIRKANRSPYEVCVDNATQQNGICRLRCYPQDCTLRCSIVENIAVDSCRARQ